MEKQHDEGMVWRWCPECARTELPRKEICKDCFLRFEEWEAARKRYQALRKKIG